MSSSMGKTCQEKILCPLLVQHSCGHAMRSPARRSILGTLILALPALHAASSPPWQLSSGPCRSDTHSQRGGQGTGVLVRCRVPGLTTHP